MNLVDSSGWIEYFFAGFHASFFSGPIEDVGRLIVPSICLYEVFKKVFQVADEARALRAVAQMKLARVIDMNEDIAIKAALISIKRRLPMADSIILATAQLEKSIIWTLDSHFKEIPGTKMP